MNSRRLWNSHQRHKFLRAEASRDILKFRASEISFPGDFKRYFPPWILCCFIRILATLGTMPSKCCRHSTTSHTQFECFTDLNLFKLMHSMSLKTGKMDALQFYSMVLIFCTQLW